MANRSDDPELDARIKEIDARIPSPSDRATRIWTLLQTHDPELTTWDILCFCAEFMGMTSQRYQWILPLSKRFVRLVYSAHYYDEHRTDSEFDRITAKVEPEHTTGQQNASPKSLFNLPGADASSVGIRRSDKGVETPIHVSDSGGAGRETAGTEDAGRSGNGDVGKPTG